MILMEDVKVHGSNSTSCASMPSEAILALFFIRGAFLVKLMGYKIDYSHNML